MLNLFTIIGARPQFIKAAALSHQIAKQSGIRETLVHTGQHYDANMSDVFFDELGIPKPDFHLGVSGGKHGMMTGRMLEALEALFLEQRPDVVLVYGDTNSTLAGALAAAKLHIPIVHVEAGLRSFNRKMPEEINRILTDHCATLLLTPSETAVQNLAQEGISQQSVINCGDVMYDLALRFAKIARAGGHGPEKFDVEEGSYVLSTIHRQENTDVPERLAACVEGLEKVAQTMPVLLPLHPRTRARLGEAGLMHRLNNVRIMEPLGYLDMVGLQAGASVIATDSGGVQKEAFFHNVPCVTLRDETEWVELVEAGWNSLITPTSADDVCDAILAARGRQGNHLTANGSGMAARKIVDALNSRWGKG